MKYILLKKLKRTFEYIEYHYNRFIFNSWNKAKKYLHSNNIIKYRFIVSADEIYSSKQNRKYANIIKKYILLDNYKKIYSSRETRK